MNLIRLILIGMLTVFALNLTAKLLWAHQMSWWQCTASLWGPPLVLVAWLAVTAISAAAVWLYIVTGRKPK